MRLEKMISLLNQSIPYNEDSQQELKSLTEEYPYFQMARLLYALHLYKLKDSGFNGELRKTAAYLSDRKPLFYLLESSFFSPQKIRMLENDPDEIASFELIDSFLEGKSDMATEVDPAEHKGLQEEKKQLIAATDYVSYLLSNDSGTEESKTKSDVFVPPMRYQDQIDRFILAEEPFRIELKDGDEFPGEFPFPIQDEPLEDSFFSESLAKIYIKQRKYDKALKIIRELNLLYPKKNRYFADQIRFLEKLIINTSKIK